MHVKHFFLTNAMPALLYVIRYSLIITFSCPILSRKLWFSSIINRNDVYTRHCTSYVCTFRFCIFLLSMILCTLGIKFLTCICSTEKSSGFSPLPGRQSSLPPLQHSGGASVCGAPC